MYLLKYGGARENLFSRAGNQGNFWQNADVSLYNVQSNDEVSDMLGSSLLLLWSVVRAKYAKYRKNTQF